MEQNRGNKYRINLRDSSNRRHVVNFDVTPDLSESRQVNYKSIDPVHMPGQFYAYNNTQGRTFSLSSVKLISRSREEADLILRRIQLLRSWTMPRFGNSSTLSRENRNNRVEFAEYAARNSLVPNEQTKIEWEKVNDKPLGYERLGAPPAVLLLTAYATPSDSSMGNIKRVPVVLNSLTITYPSDTSYIPSATTGQPVPTIMNIDLSLLESHSPTEYSKFSLYHYRNGLLGGF